MLKHFKKMTKIDKLIADYSGKGKSIILPYSKILTGGFEVNISKYSGLVSVIKRRDSKKIAQLWSDRIFGKKFNRKTYTANNPAVIARHTYVLETVLNKINLKKKSLCDIGAGEGNFLKLIDNKNTGCKTFGIEPSKKNCLLMKKKKIDFFNGTLEDYYEYKNKKKFDIITFTWTLCNMSNCLNAINIAFKLLKKKGIIIIAEGSRILVPFKKPLHMYFNKENPDTHPFHFSKNSLLNLLIINKFKPIFINRYIDSDYLVIIGEKTRIINTKKIKIDNYKKVKKFFISWFNDSKKY